LPGRMPGLVLWPCLRITEGRTVQAAGCSRYKLAATRSIEAAIADVGSIPIPGSKIFCDSGHETGIGVLRGKLIGTSNALY